jgi:hypothetical protein
MKPSIAAAVLVAALATVPACYGSYGAFHAVHGWNRGVSSNNWVRSGVHLALWIVPVYELTLFADFFIFNTVEHLTGKRVF